MAEDTAIDGLSTAAAQGNLMEIEQILQSNVNVNEKNKFGRTPLQVRLSSPRTTYTSKHGVYKAYYISLTKTICPFLLSVTMSSGLVNLLLNKPVFFFLPANKQVALRTCWKWSIFYYAIGLVALVIFYIKHLLCVLKTALLHQSDHELKKI